MKKLMTIFILGLMTMSISASELGEKDSRCIYTKCEMDRSVAKELKKSDSDDAVEKSTKSAAVSK